MLLSRHVSTKTTEPVLFRPRTKDSIRCIKAILQMCKQSISNVLGFVLKTQNQGSALTIGWLVLFVVLLRSDDLCTVMIFYPSSQFQRIFSIVLLYTSLIFSAHWWWQEGCPPIHDICLSQMLHTLSVEQKIHFNFAPHEKFGSSCGAKVTNTMFGWSRPCWASNGFSINQFPPPFPHQQTMVVWRKHKDHILSKAIRVASTQSVP